MEELLARVFLAAVPLARAQMFLGNLRGGTDSRRACWVAWSLRRAAEALHDAADALEEWGELAKLREGRFKGSRRGR